MTKKISDANKFSAKSSFDYISENCISVCILIVHSTDFCFFSQEPKQMVVPKTVTATVAPSRTVAVATRGAPLTTTMMTVRKRITHHHHSSRSLLPKPQLRSSQRRRRHQRRQRQSRPKSQSTSIQSQNRTIFR